MFYLAPKEGSAVAFGGVSTMQEVLMIEGGLALIAGTYLVPVRLILLGVLLLAAAGFDIASRRIPNVLVFGGIALGLACQAAFPFGVSFAAALMGLGAGFAAMLPLYLLRAMGAGDVKLMAMAGVFLGPLDTLGAVLATFVVGGIMGVAVVLVRRDFRRLVQNLRLMLFAGHARLVTGELPTFEDLPQSVGRLPYAVAIAVGATAYLLWRY